MSNQVHTRKTELLNTINYYPILFTDTITLSSQPELHHLDLIEGSGKTVRVIKESAAKWESIATRLYFDSHDISRIRKDYHLQSYEACQTVFIEWLDGNGRKPATWDTLIHVLNEADLSVLATDLKVVILKD